MKRRPAANHPVRFNSSVSAIMVLKPAQITRSSIYTELIQDFEAIRELSMNSMPKETAFGTSVRSATLKQLLYCAEWHVHSQGPGSYSVTCFGLGFRTMV